MGTLLALERIGHPSYDGDEPLDLTQELETILGQIYNVLRKSPRVAKALTFQVTRRKTGSTQLLARTASIRKSNFDDTTQKRLLNNFRNDPRGFWAPVDVNANLHRGNEQRGAPTEDEETDDRSRLSLLQDPLCSVLGTCLQFDILQGHVVLQVRILWVIVWILSNILPSQFQAASVAERFHTAGLFNSISKTHLQDKIHRICNRGRNLWHILIFPLGWGALIACPIDIASSMWDYASLHDIDNRESHDEQELKELEEIKRVINVLKSVAGERASQYELFAVRVVRTRLESLVGSDPRLNSYLPGGLDRQPAPGNGDIGQSHALLPEPHTFSDTVGTVLAPAGVAAIDTNHPRNDLPESHVNPPSHKNTSLPGFHRGRPESAGGNLPGSFTAGCGRESQHGRERVAGHPPAPKRPRLARGQQDDNQSGELSEHSDAIKDCRGKSQVGRNHIDPSVSSRDAGTSLDGLREPSLDTDQFTPDLVDIDAQRYEFRLLAITGSAGSTENTRSADWMAEVDENLDRTNAEQNTEAFTNDLPNPASIGEPPDSQSPLDSNGHSPVVTDIQIVACDNANVTNAYTPIRYHPSAVNHFSNPRPQLQLPIESRVPDTAQSIWLAMKGNIDGLKYMFSQRLASPRDVSSTRGFSLLDWALYGGMRNYKTAQFLLHQGASVDENSFQHVWDYAFRVKCNPTEWRELQCITLNPASRGRSWINEQQFPLIHRIVLGLHHKPLATELNDNPDAVRVVDARGRTALDWATARGQLSDMTVLIACGSPIDTMDVSGRTTILHAVDSHNDHALRTILEAGADPNPEVPEGLFRSSPLTAASFGGLAGMIKLLIRFGAKVDACNPEGRTALHVVAGTQNVECARILLTFGADMNYVSNNGHSPLMTAIINNSHDVLKLFVARCHTSRLSGLKVLPTIAESADVRTMSIFASSDSKENLFTGNNFVVSHEILRARADYGETLGKAFEELVSAVQSSCT